MRLTKTKDDTSFIDQIDKNIQEHIKNIVDIKSRLEQNAIFGGGVNYSEIEI